jgi:hypothetical protein
MKSFLCSVFLVLLWAPFVFAEDAQPSKFATLKDALTFIDHGLDAADWKGLSNALYPPLQPNEPNRTNWSQLKDARGASHLADVFSDQDFPTSDVFIIKVPRHGLMGGSRVKFVKVDDGWCINAVYIVR